MFQLRYYQQDAYDAILGKFDDHCSTACVMPTGTGKTELFLSLAVAQRDRVLVIVHRDYLIHSPVARLASVGFDDVGIEKAEERSERSGRRSKVVFASVQSIGPERQLHRLRTFDPKDFSLVIVDEGHRAVSPIYRRVLEYMKAGNPRLKVLILTATPKRKDGMALGNVCESVAYEMTPARAVEEGWIVRPKFFSRQVSSLDFSKVKMLTNDFDEDQVAELLMDEKPLHEICASLAEFQGPTIMFCPRVNVAHAYSAMMNRYRRDKSMVVHQDSTDDDMERAKKGLADGSVDWVWNVDKLTEGYDVPRVVRVGWTSPTASLVRWTQGNGRAFRTDPSVAKHLKGNLEDAPQRRLLIEQSSKPFCEILTYDPRNCKHQICGATDLLGGTLGGPAMKYAKQIEAETSRQSGGSDTAYDIETANVFLDLVAVLDEKRRHIKAQAKVVDQEFDGLGGGSTRKMAGENRDKSSAESQAGVSATWVGGEPITGKQAWWFRTKQIATPAGMTKFRAIVVRDLIDFGVQPATAFSYPKRQAMKVRDDMRLQNGGAS